MVQRLPHRRFPPFPRLLYYCGSDTTTNLFVAGTEKEISATNPGGVLMSNFLKIVLFSLCLCVCN